MDICSSTSSRISEYSVFVNFLLGFWFFSNREIFYNEIKPLKFQNGKKNHEHPILEGVWNKSPGTPFLIFLVIHLVIESKFFEMIS